MNKRTLPGLPIGRPQIAARSYVSPQAFSRWAAHSDLRAAVEAEEADRTIGIYDVIGEDWWTGAGFTSKRMASALRALGKGPVTVAINSPGGDMFEGSAMYSMLREHDGEVTVKVMGVAASAASIIAMAGDSIRISRVGFFMIHNCWVIVEGNRNDLRDTADALEPFDAAMADVYATRTGEDLKAIQKLMDRESWIGGAKAVEGGFADALLDSDEMTAVEGDPAPAASIRRMESALRASGMTKLEAMRLISEFKSAGAGDPTGSGRPGDPGPREPVEAMAETIDLLRDFSLSLK